MEQTETILAKTKTKEKQQSSVLRKEKKKKNLNLLPSKPPEVRATHHRQHLMVNRKKENDNYTLTTHEYQCTNQNPSTSLNQKTDRMTYTHFFFAVL